MHIKEIEFQNFKSFGRKVKIPFFDGFTTISGPNGSGKSNIVDGILFCLGLSSSRTMRAEKLTDLIYNGEGKKKPDYAQVIIRFDNYDREMPLDADEVVIARKVRQTNAGYYSYYYFNDKAASLTEIHNILAKARITPEGYNVVMQGDVANITQMTANERRKIIDEIAGVSEFDNKKDRAMSELDIVKERIERVDIILAEVGAQLDKLQRERDQALKYQSLQEEKLRFEGYMLLSKFKDAQNEFDKIVEEISSRLEGESELEALLKKKQEKMTELESVLKALNTQITSMGEEEQIAIKRQIEEIKGEIALSQNTITLTESERSDMDTQRRKGLIEIDGIKEKMAELSSKIEEEKNRKLGIASEIEDQRTQLLILRSKIAEVDSRFVRTRDELSQVKNDLEEARNRKNELMRLEDRLLDAMRRRSAELKDIEEEIEDSKRKIKSADDDREDVEQEIEGVNKQMAELSDDIDDLESNRAQLKSVQKDLDDTLRGLQQEYMTAEARIRAAKEVSGYSNAVEKVLKAKDMRELPGIYGTIAQLGKVDQEYAIALEVAAGGRMQGIVVDTDEDASRAISFLKRQRGGRATFLPLNKMAGNSGFRDVSNMAGVIGYAINLVDYDSKYEPAFNYVFRDTIVVEDLNTGRRLMGGLRMVTLDGEVVEKSGAMTGGSRGRSGVSFAATEEDKITKLAEQITEYESRRSAAINKLDSVEGHIASVQTEMRELETVIAKKQMAIEEINSRGERLTALITEKEVGRVEIEAGSAELRGEMESIEDDKQTSEKEIVKLEGKAKELEEQLKGSKVPELNEQAQRIEDEIRRLENRTRDIESNINNLKTESKFATDKTEEIKVRLAELDGRKVELRQKINELRTKIVELDSSLKDKTKRENELDVELADMRKRREDLQMEFSAWQKQLEEVKVRLENSRRQMIALNATRDTLAEQIKEYRSELDERGVELTDEVPTLEEVQTRMASIVRAMTKLEPVNMRAIDEYDEVERRSIDLKYRRDTLNHELEEILERIHRYEQMKKQAFMECFDGINEHFKVIFPELSDGPGELILENEDDPFAGGLTMKVQPKDKTLQRMESRSGGEKSLISMTLLFSIQQYRPAPFYAFDEVDMNLDGANAEKMAKRIKESSKTAQFIVVSLRKPMVQAAERTIGVTMQDNDITSITGVKLN
ncbi:MAG: chromosome segregation protein SMC [Methanosarcinales archaeon]|nr:chromosome segregation protein SMC [Methanosarcinales archaeon]